MFRKLTSFLVLRPNKTAEHAWYKASTAIYRTASWVSKYQPTARCRVTHKTADCTGRPALRQPGTLPSHTLLWATRQIGWKLSSRCLK